MKLLRADLNDVNSLDSDFKYAMCRFIMEVVKVKDGSDYSGHTLYQFCVGIQKYLTNKSVNWKLVEGDFKQLCTVLDNVMKERAKTVLVQPLEGQM